MSTQLAPLELVETSGQTDLGPEIVHAVCGVCYPRELHDRAIALCGTETATRTPDGPKCIVCRDLFGSCRQCGFTR